MKYQLSLREGRITLSQDGHLQSLNDWSPEVAKALALDKGLTLDSTHWEIIEVIRDFYAKFQLAPNMRALVNYSKEKLGQDKGNSLYINRLFQGGSAKEIARLAGLPKPHSCL